MGLDPVKPRDAPIYCSFCGRLEDEVEAMVAGPCVFICGDCVKLCSEIIENGWHRKGPRMTIEAEPTPVGGTS